MKNVEQIIAKKQAEIERLRNEIIALKTVLPLLTETAPATQPRQSLPPALSANARLAAPNSAPVRVKQPINVVRRISLQT